MVTKKAPPCRWHFLLMVRPVQDLRERHTQNTQTHEWKATAEMYLGGQGGEQRVRRTLPLPPLYFFLFSKLPLCPGKKEREGQATFSCVVLLRRYG